MKHQTLQDLSDKELLTLKLEIELRKMLRKKREREAKLGKHQGAQVIFLAQYRAKRVKA